MKPLAIDLFCGMGGWTDGLLEADYDVIGVDIERHQYGEHRYPGKLIIQDIRTLHGSQFRTAALIVASPPCQEFSYMAMPWSKAKAKAAAIRADASGEALRKLRELFDTCFRIQREACEAAGRHVPLIVENVKGAQKWVGRARWNYGSFYLWGDVPALMPPIHRRNDYRKSPNESWSPSRPSYTRDHGWKNAGGSWFRVAHNTTSGKGQNPDGRKGNGGTWFHEYGPNQGSQNFSSKSLKRKFASAMIAKIPLPLSRHIGRTFYPKDGA